MDNKELLESLQKHFDYRMDDLKEDVKVLDEKLEQQGNRLTKLESEQGWIQRGLLGTMAALLSIGIAYIKKLFI